MFPLPKLCPTLKVLLRKQIGSKGDCLTVDMILTGSGRIDPWTMLPCLSSLVAIVSSLQNSHASGLPLISIIRSRPFEFPQDHFEVRLQEQAVPIDGIPVDAKLPCFLPVSKGLLRNSENLRRLLDQQIVLEVLQIAIPPAGRTIKRPLY
jgi:hypothetical protein